MSNEDENDENNVLRALVLSQQTYINELEEKIKFFETKTYDEVFTCSSCKIKFTLNLRYDDVRYDDESERCRFCVLRELRRAWGQ